MYEIFCSDRGLHYSDRLHTAYIQECRLHNSSTLPPHLTLTISRELEDQTGGTTFKLIQIGVYYLKIEHSFVSKFLVHITILVQTVERTMSEMSGTDMVSSIEFWVVGVVLMVVSIGGIMGNIICILMFQYKRLNMNQTFVSLLWWLAVIDSIFLVSLLSS